MTERPAPAISRRNHRPKRARPTSPHQRMPIGKGKRACLQTQQNRIWRSEHRHDLLRRHLALSSPPGTMPGLCSTPTGGGFLLRNPRCKARGRRKSTKPVCPPPQLPSSSMTHPTTYGFAFCRLRLLRLKPRPVRPCPSTPSRTRAGPSFRRQRISRHSLRHPCLTGKAHRRQTRSRHRRPVRTSGTTPGRPGLRQPLQHRFRRRGRTYLSGRPLHRRRPCRARFQR